MAEAEEDQQTPPKTIELHEVEEGESKQSSNYIFQQIGSPLRLNPNSSSFDLDNPPTQALAISHKPQSLLFLAHSKGFYVAKTVEVVSQAELAKKEGNNKSCCIEKFCVVDVQIGQVRSLAVSKDSSTLAVCVGAEVHFFSIASLLNKEQEPFLSRAIDDSSYVKDFRWRKKLENSFLVLGSDGRLYYGDLDSPLKEVMENVDAVEWSPEGNFMAVAKQDSLSIFSPRFREQFTMSMPFSLVVTDTDSECTIKVDSISWIREDCIILGCFQIVGDDEENGYLVQVVSCKEGSISEGSSALVIVSFNEAFVGIDDDALPFGCGPHLFLNYLEHGNVAFLANKKSTDAHIQLFSWSLDAIQKEAVQVDLIQDDKYLPRILYQENEDDNMVMGFGVDTISLREKDKVTLEVESKELSPYCILLCLTLDEKLLMFYVADATVSDDSRKTASPFSDEVEKTSTAISLSCDSSDTSSRSMEHNVKETTSDAQSLKMRRDETDEGSLVLKGHESQTPDLNDNFKKSMPSPQPSISERESLRLDKSTLAYGSDSLSKDSIMMQKPVFSSSGVLGASTGSTPSIFQSKPKEHNVKEMTSDAQSLKMRRDELETDEGSLALKGHESQTPDLNDNFKKSTPSPQPSISERESLSLDKSTLAYGSDSLFKDSIMMQKPAFSSSGVLGASTGSTPSIFQSKPKEHNVKETTSDAQSLKMRRDELETDEGSLVLEGHESQTPDLNDNFKKSTPSPQPSISERESLRLDKSTLAYGSDSLSKDSIMMQKPFFSSSGVMGASTGSTPSIFQSKPKDPLGSDEASKLFSKNFQRDGLQSASLGSHSSHKLSSDSLGGNEASNLFSRNFQRDGLQSVSSGSYSSDKLSSSNEFNSRFNSTEIKRVEQSGSRVQSTVNVTGLSDTRLGNNLNTRESNSVPQFSTNVSARSTLIGGQKSSAGATKFASEPGMRSSQVSPYGGSSSQNTLESKLQPPDEKVNEMAKELDFLLSGIEKEGGFRDACIMFQEDSVLGIEQDLENLTKRCRVLKSMMEERFEGVHNLLDQTVQVLARKIYIEGIVKQASDSQYWDLWDRQKLTPELELKRKQILKVNQNLTNQLIELERHFNTLELNKFGENNEVRSDRRVLQISSKSSRDGQAFHKLYNTMNSQLAAAEQLSECLTKQMAVLNIESPSAKRKSVAKELFESIGLSYDGDSFKSPNVKNAIHSPESVKKLSVSSARGAMKDQSGRNPSSVVKNFESETARRRVSLDRSWASFTPPKTTVKRMLLQEERPRMNADKSSLVANKASVKQISPVAHLRDHKIFSVPLPSYVNKDEATSQLQGARDNEDEASKQVPFKWTKDLSGKSLSATLKSPALQVSHGRNLLSSSLPCETQNITNEIIDRGAIGRTRVNKFDQSSVQTIPYSNATPTLFTESSVNRNSATASLAPNRTPQMYANVQSSLNYKDTQTKSMSHAVNHREASQEIAVNAPVKSHEPELTRSASPAVILDKGGFQNETVKKDIQLGSSPVNPVSVSPSRPSLPETIKAPVLEISTPLSIPSSSTSSLSLVKSEDSFKTSTNAEIPSTSSFSSSCHSTSPLSFSFQTGNQQFNPSKSSATTNISSQVHSTDIKTTTPLMEPKPSVGQLSLKSDVNVSQASPVRSEPPSVAAASTAFVTTSVVTDVKNESSDLAATQEDEMEEEASETTTDLNLGSLGGFGLGSAPTSAAPKSNIFGSTFQNTAATSSFNLTVPSGELFRPASFSIQPTQPSQPASQSAFSSQFTVPEPARSGFGQPAQIGSGQQALGSVLGSFGQSRQLGITPPGSGFTSTAVLGGGGFANSAPGFGGGFAAAAPMGGGFAGVGSGGGGGFAGAGSGGGGGFAGAGSGGFGSFSNQQGGSAFSSFGGSSAGSGNPNPLFTQMRK